MQLHGQLRYPADVATTYPLAATNGQVLAWVPGGGPRPLALTLRCGLASATRTGRGELAVAVVDASAPCSLTVAFAGSSRLPATYDAFVAYSAPASSS
ncbi:MAG TPA: hypothetical protein VKV23_06960 [Acidimicrobiales bacterium]|nr:hypothetical protein [Acidimicrobiales bacterium]